MFLTEIARQNPRQRVVSLEPWMFHSKDQISDWLTSVGLHSRNIHIDDSLEIQTNQEIRLEIEWTQIPSDVLIGAGDDIVQNVTPTVHDNWKFAHHQNLRLLPVQFGSSGNFTVDVPLESLIGIPYRVHGSLSIRNAAITDMHGFPEFVANSAYIMFTRNMENLDGMNNAHIGERSISLVGNGKATLNSLIGISDSILELSVHNITSFKGIDKSNVSNIWLSCNEGIKTKVLGILLSSKVRFVKFVPNTNNQRSSEELRDVIDIVNKHLKLEKDMLDCQEELIKAGFKEYAKI